jgi:hypothetical protein
MLPRFNTFHIVYHRHKNDGKPLHTRVQLDLKATTCWAPLMKVIVGQTTFSRTAGIEKNMHIYTIGVT